MADSIPLIFNPRSRDGAGEAIARDALAALASRGVRADPIATEGPGGAAPLAERLAREGHATILAIGGDGTHSEAADGVLRSGAGAALGFLPSGTANDFLHDFGVDSLDEAAARVATMKPRAIDAAVARWPGGERHFINVFGIGFAAKVCDLANRRLKWMGARAYTAAVFPELLRLKSPLTRLTLDGEVVERPLALVTACNTAHTGGRMRMAPMASAEDGLLEVVALEDVSRSRLLRLFTLLFKGEHIGQRNVLHWRAREVTMEPATPSPLLGDGELYGATPVTVRVLPGALRVLL